MPNAEGYVKPDGEIVGEYFELDLFSMPALRANVRHASRSETWMAERAAAKQRQAPRSAARRHSRQDGEVSRVEEGGFARDPEGESESLPSQRVIETLASSVYAGRKPERPGLTEKPRRLRASYSCNRAPLDSRLPKPKKEAFYARFS